MTFLNPFIGGLLIGSAAVFLLFVLGRVAGISGILSGAATSIFSSVSPLISWQLLFVLGLPIGAWMAHYVTGISPPELPESNIGLVVLAGLLVGYGTRLGSGCTSGHGVCGIARFSLRSIVSTCIFMAAGIVTVALVRLSGVTA